jgi:DNA-binding transcriptional MerR regulator
VATRTHLSIGEVLSLLREEFPDVTISKIRFLESQGLVDPERTPSGYRKFYDHDVERLRWILRQQREHFLPLKVIKGRLSEQGDDAEPTLPLSEFDDAEPAPPGHAGAAPADAGTGGPDEPAAVAAGEAPQGAGATTSPPRSAAERHRATGSRSPDQAAAAVDPAAPDRSHRPARASTRSGPDGPENAAAVSTPGGERRGGATSRRGPADGGAVAAAGPEDGGPAMAGGTTGESSGAAGAGGARRARTSTSRGGAPATPAARRGASEPGAGAGEDVSEEDETLTAEELGAAVGADAKLVEGLREYGLVSARTVVGGVAYYDPDAVVVVRAAAGFARHGVEPRHLRAWRNSAEREAGLFEQVVMPLLRQRNPEARRQAVATLAELDGLGADLREAMVQRALREIR